MNFHKRQVEHIMKHAELFCERHSFFYQVITAILIDKAAADVIAVTGKAGIIVLF